MSDMPSFAQVCDLGVLNEGRGEGMVPLPLYGPDPSGSALPTPLAHCASKLCVCSRRAANSLTRWPLATCEPHRRLTRRPRWGRHMSAAPKIWHTVSSFGNPLWKRI